ncbi:glutathione S-transferase family protein [Oxalobacteraceae bacterium]|nr:glutathione S-transferase family protein [Oxalobacteraceae bacterium]
MDQLTLFGNRESGHTFKVRMMLDIGALPYLYEEVDIFGPQALRPARFRALAKFNEVPLLLHEGQAYVQSNAILCHLAQHTRRFGGESAARMDRVREWLFWEANRIGLSLPNLRYGLQFAPNDYPIGVLPWLRQRFDDDIARLEAEFSDGRQFILDDQASVADFALSGYLFWAAQARVTVPPALVEWLDRISAQPGWQPPHRTP